MGTTNNERVIVYVADFDLHIPPKWKAYQLMK